MVLNGPRFCLAPRASAAASGARPIMAPEKQANPCLPCPTRARTCRSHTPPGAQQSTSPALHPLMTTLYSPAPDAGPPPYAQPPPIAAHLASSRL